MHGMCRIMLCSYTKWRTKYSNQKLSKTYCLCLGSEGGGGGNNYKGDWIHFGLKWEGPVTPPPPPRASQTRHLQNIWEADKNIPPLVALTWIRNHIKVIVSNMSMDNSSLGCHSFTLGQFTHTTDLSNGFHGIACHWNNCSYIMGILTWFPRTPCLTSISQYAAYNNWAPINMVWFTWTISHLKLDIDLQNAQGTVLW